MKYASVIDGGAITQFGSAPAQVLRFVSPYMRFRRASAKALRGRCLEACGLLPVVKLDNPKRRKMTQQKRLTSISGSMTLNELHIQRRSRSAQQTAHQQGVERRKMAAVLKRAVVQSKAAELHDAFMKCRQQCTCDSVPCKFEGWVLCPQCGPKKGLCRVKACKDARLNLSTAFDTEGNEVNSDTEGECT